MATMVEQFNNLRSAKHSSVGCQLQNSLRNVEITAPIQTSSAPANLPTITGPYISLAQQNGLTSSLPPTSSTVTTTTSNGRPASGEVVVRRTSLRTGSMRSGRIFGDDDLSEMWKSSPVYCAPSDEEGEEGEGEGAGSDDSEVPEMLRKLSQSGFPFTRNQSDTISSEIIVNSISNGQ